MNINKDYMTISPATVQANLDTIKKATRMFRDTGSRKTKGVIAAPLPWLDAVAELYGKPSQQIELIHGLAVVVSTTLPNPVYVTSTGQVFPITGVSQC